MGCLISEQMDANETLWRGIDCYCGGEQEIEWQVDQGLGKLLMATNDVESSRFPGPGTIV